MSFPCPGGDCCFIANNRKQQNLSKNLKNTIFLGFQTTRSALFWRGFGTSSSFRGMLFSPQEVIFSKLFYCSSCREQNLSKNILFLSEAWCSPAREVIAVLLLAAAGNRICRKFYRKMLIFSDFRRRVRCFFGVVLELARLSEAWCFPPGRWFFRNCFNCSSRRQQNLSKNVLFLSEAWCFPAREVIALLLLTTAGNRICRKILKNIVFLGFQTTY